MSEESKPLGYTEEEVCLIEAILFSSPRPVPLNELKKAIGSRHKGGVKGIVDKLNERYAAGAHSFRIREIAGGFQYYLIPDYAVHVEKYFSVQRDRRLTPAGLETLAIIAYKQPITKGEIEQIRGVAADGVVATLLERKLIKPAGRADKVGKPLLYGTSAKFLEYFGINSLAELPRLTELAKPKSHPDGQPELQLVSESDTDSDETTDVEALPGIAIAEGADFADEPLLADDDSAEDPDQSGS